MERAGALAPAIGARRIGTRMPNRWQNAFVQSPMLIANPQEPPVHSSNKGRGGVTANAENEECLERNQSQE